MPNQKIYLNLNQVKIQIVPIFIVSHKISYNTWTKTIYHVATFALHTISPPAVQPTFREKRLSFRSTWESINFMRSAMSL